MAYEDALWYANYPSLYVPNLAGSLTVQRTVEDQTGVKATWKLSVSAPSDLTVTVPKKINVPANGTYSFLITVSAPPVPQGEVRHATLRMTSNRGGSLTFPITIVRGQAVVEMSKTCAPSVLRVRESTSCSITLTNTGFDDASFNLIDMLPKQLRLTAGTVVGGTQIGRKNGVQASGVLQGAEPPDVNVTVDPLASTAGFYALGGVAVA